MKSTLHINLLGSPVITLGDLRAKEFPAEKVKLLFFYLLLFRHMRHSRQVLAGLFWGNYAEAQARHSFNTALWRLRQWINGLHVMPAPYLVVESEKIGLNTAACWLDAAEFEERVIRARQMNSAAPDQAAASLKRAVELYHGELLEGCYADWCLIERDRLHQLFLQSLVHLIIYHAGRREYPQAIACAQRILQDDPLREDVQRELMKLFALDNQPAEALQQYRRCAVALREELGIEPMPETQEIFRQLILKSTSTPAEQRPDGIRFPPNTKVQVSLFSQEIAAALEHLEKARDEFSKGVEKLRQITDGAGSSGDA